MKVKRFEAATLQEALLNVKRDLGSDAVILQTRRFSRGGLFGFLGKDVVEVLAAVEVNTAGSAAPVQRPKNESLVKAAAEVRNIRAASAATASAADPIRDEVKALKESLNKLMSDRRYSEEMESRNVNPYSSVIGDVYIKLIENDVDDKLAKEIIQAVDQAVPEASRDDAMTVHAALSRHLRRLIKVSGAIDLEGGFQKTVAFVGPTGIGKTTTIAKLATIYSLSQRKKVGIITADTFRIAAVEQIKVYGEIIDVPIKVVYNKEDMRHAMAYFSDRDLVLIDTAGRSHWDTDRIMELRDILSACYPLEINLALAANIRYKDMVDIAERFRPLAYNHLLFTKLDETSTFGSLLNLMVKCNTGVSYLCYGQNVPGEIQAATVDSMVGLTTGRPISKIQGKAGVN